MKLPILLILLSANVMALDECYYNSDGSVDKYPCTGFIATRLAMPGYPGTVELRSYTITYTGYHLCSEVMAECDARACVYIDRKAKLADIHYVYGDTKALKHEEAHITHPWNWH